MFDKGGLDKQQVQRHFREALSKCGRHHFEHARLPRLNRVPTCHVRPFLASHATTHDPIRQLALASGQRHTRALWAGFTKCARVHQLRCVCGLGRKSAEARIRSHARTHARATDSGFAPFSPVARGHGSALLGGGNQLERQAAENGANRCLSAFRHTKSATRPSDGKARQKKDSLKRLWPRGGMHLCGEVQEPHCDGRCALAHSSAGAQSDSLHKHVERVPALGRIHARLTGRSA